MLQKHFDKKNKAVFLDRDGVLNTANVLNGTPHPPQCLAEVTIPNGVLSALNQLKQAGFHLIVITNQPDVARKKTTIKTVETIHQFLKNTLPLDDFYVCYHDDHDKCTCRKPLPGLINQAVDEHAIDVSQSFMIGDRWKDIEAGKRANCRTIFLDYTYKENHHRTIEASFTANNLLAAANFILEGR